MSAETIYDAIHEVIADQSQLDDELSMFELIGVIRMVEADLIKAAQADDDDSDDENLEVSLN
jgi:hypothetical protein